MNASFDKLDELIQTLTTCVNEQDVEGLTSCDAKVREEVLRLTASYPDDPLLAKKIESVRIAYADMVTSMSDVRDKLGDDLRQLTKENHAINQYLGVGR